MFKGDSLFKISTYYIDYKYHLKHFKSQNESQVIRLDGKVAETCPDYAEAIKKIIASVNLKQ